ncbi:hypothetical protein AZSI13_10050 [Azospira sp. I13]|nr:hypothetical protein AZSI13_10050 [Azospira sp. I13]
MQHAEAGTPLPGQLGGPDQGPVGSGGEVGGEEQMAKDVHGKSGHEKALPEGASVRRQGKRRKHRGNTAKTC